MEGNQMKMREALEKLVEIIDNCDGSSPLWWHCGAKGVMPLKNAKTALASPPRNCDVGTAEEQEERMVRWCGQHKCESCQFFCVANDGVSCEFTWGQSPYEAEEGETKCS